MELSEQETYDRAAKLFGGLAEVLSLGELAVEEGRARLLFGEDSEQVEVELEARTSGWLYIYAPLRPPAHWDEATLRRALGAGLSRLAGASLALAEETGTPLLLMTLPLAQLESAVLAEILERFVAQASALVTSDLATALASQAGAEPTAGADNQEEEILRI